MNFCSQADKIVDYCLDQLTEEEKREFLLHVASCKICQRELALEQTIEAELVQDFDPGFIENRFMMRLQLRQARDPRSFWLYTFRMVVYGIAAAIAGFVLIPLLLGVVAGVAPKFGQYMHGITEVAGRITPDGTFFVLLGVSLIAVVMASMYSLVQMRR